MRKTLDTTRRINGTLDPHPDATAQGDLDPGRRVCCRRDWPCLDHWPCSHLRHDGDGHQARFTAWGCGQLVSPLEQLIGVDVMPPGDDRHRCARPQRLGNELTLQRFRPAPTSATRLPGVHFAVSGHLSFPGHHAAQCPARTTSEAGGAHRKATRVLNAELEHHLDGEAAEGRPNSRNGYGKKTLLTDTGKLPIAVHRDTLTLRSAADRQYRRRLPGLRPRALGGGRREDAKALVLHAILINLALGLATSALFLVFGRQIYGAVGGEGGSLEAALRYSNVVFAGNVLVWLKARDRHQHLRVRDQGRL